MSRGGGGGGGEGGGGPYILTASFNTGSAVELSA